MYGQSLLKVQRVSGAPMRTGPARPLRVRPARSYNWNREESPETDPVRLVDEVGASSGLFTDQFKAVLQSTVSRTGAKALLDGQERPEHDRISGQEEVISAAIVSCRATLLKLQLIRQETEKAIEAESKQMERLQFLFEKARNDAAYYRSIQARMMEGNNSD